MTNAECRRDPELDTVAKTSAPRTPRPPSPASDSARAVARSRRSGSAATADTPLDPELRQRVVIENVTPEVDEGRFPAKRTVGEAVVVEADVFADGHDL